MREIARKLIRKYGEEHEKLKVLEELNELSNEIFRDINHNESSRMSILEERTDVELMLAMIDEIYEFNEKNKGIMWESKLNKIREKYLKEE